MRNEISLTWAWGLPLNQTPWSPWTLPWQETIVGETWYFAPQSIIFFLGLLMAWHKSPADLQVLLMGIQFRTNHSFLKDSRSTSRLPYICAWWDYIKLDGLTSGAFLCPDEEEWEQGSKQAVAEDQFGEVTSWCAWEVHGVWGVLALPGPCSRAGGGVWQGGCMAALPAPAHLGGEMWRALRSLLWSWLKLKTCRRLCHFSHERMEVTRKRGGEESKKREGGVSLFTPVPLLLGFQCSFLNFWEGYIKKEEGKQEQRWKADFSFFFLFLFFFLS